jgi:hypothetical protein
MEIVWVLGLTSTGQKKRGKKLKNLMRITGSNDPESEAKFAG